MVAINNLKNRLTEELVLRIFNPSAGVIELHTDVSQWSFGVVLLQTEINEQLHLK